MLFSSAFCQNGKIEVLTNYNVNRNAIYSSQNLYGIINEDGSKTIAAEFDTIYKSERFCYSEECQCFIAEKKSQYYFINYKGQLKPRIAFDSLFMISDFRNSRYSGYKNDTLYFFKSNGQIITTEYDRMLYGTGSSIFTIKNEKLGLIDIDNNIIIDFEYDNLKYARHNAYLIAEKNGKVGVIDLANQIIVPFDFEQIVPTLASIGDNDKEFVIQQNGKMGTINMDSSYWRIVIPPEYDAISGWCCGGPHGHYIIKNGKEGFATVDGKVIIEPKFEGLNETYGGFIVQENNKTGVINLKGDTIIPLENDLIYDDFEKLIFNPEDTLDDKFIVLRSDNWMYYSMNGTLIQKDVDIKEIKKEKPFLIEYMDRFKIVRAFCLIKIKTASSRVNVPASKN